MHNILCLKIFRKLVFLRTLNLLPFYAILNSTGEVNFRGIRANERMGNK